MIRVIAVVACGFTVAACSAMPSLDFLKSSPPTAALRFESEPPGAEVKASGQTCRTPCELTVQVSPELSTTFALKGYQPQTISVHSRSRCVVPSSCQRAGARSRDNFGALQLDPRPELQRLLAPR